MALNIMDERVLDLVREALSRAGLTQIRVGKKAVTDLLGRLERGYISR